MRKQSNQAQLTAPACRALGKALSAGGWDFKQKHQTAGVPPISMAFADQHCHTQWRNGSSAGGMKGLHLAEPNGLGAETPPDPPWRDMGQQESPAVQLQWLTMASSTM